MKTAIAYSIILLLLAALACGAVADDGTVLAEWDGGNVTVAEYTHWWERLDPESRPDLTTMDAKVEFLENVANAMIMLEEAKARGEDRHPNVTEWAQGRRVNALRERLYQQATEGRLHVDEAEVRKIYEKRLTQIKASHIVVPTYEKARALLDSLQAGIAFEGLARRHSTCASGVSGGSLGAVRWGDFTERWSTQAFALEPGEVSEPFAVEGGYAIVKVHNKTLLEPGDPEAEKRNIRADLLRRASFAERKTFRDSLRIAYAVDINLDAVVDLCVRYAQELVDRGITSEVVSEDIDLPLTETEEELPVAGFTGRVFDYREIVDMIESEPYVVRPKLDDVDQMFSFINRHLNDSLLVSEAEKRGIDKIPEIADQLDKTTQTRILGRFYRVLVQDVKIPEDTLRAFYEANRESYVSVPGHVASKIVLETREAADSLLELIEGGGSFEEVAREHSIDPFTAPNGGDMGFYAEGKDQEFDGFFSQMEVGDIEIFRSVEGHVILWLRKRVESGLLGFESARPTVERDLTGRYRAAFIDSWIAKKRKELNLKVYQDRLAQVTLGS